MDAPPDAPVDAFADARRALALNERRQAQAVVDLADEHERCGAGVLGFTDGTPWLCKAVGVDLEHPLDDAAVASLSAWFRARGVPPAVELTDHSDEQTLAALRRAGFGLVEVEHVLTRPTPPPIEAPVPAGVEFEELDRHDEDALRLHAEIVCGGFVPPDGSVPEPVIASAMRSQRVLRARGFFARVGGEAVAASGMEVYRTSDGGDRVVALWGTTVRAPWRRRGIQQALIAHRVALGRAEGATLALIESKPAIPTRRNALRLGFALTYVRFLLKAEAKGMERQAAPSGGGS